MRCLLFKLLLPGFLAGSFSVAAQTALPAESFSLRPDSTYVRARHRRLVAQFDQRFSPLNGKLVGINGVKLGLEWRGRLRTGLGVYLLSGGVPTNPSGPVIFPAATSTELRFRYVVAYGEYVLIGTPRWELSTPTQIGFGKVFGRYYLPDGSRQQSPTDHIWLIEPSIVGHMRVFRWVGVGAGAGYRQMLFQNSNQERELSGFILIGRVKLFLGDLYKIARGRERLLSQRGLHRRNRREKATDH
ncbi:hypothetical protein [Hymenobacter sp. GOD-10R]|uniref:hypothetical protein n=1 Tax=Hymenobacter sp. GOD-10R TaxID=3093922 RepID=UPI002D772AFE|nr:hypothetical protein [Hymenobacter sp. GOD-10R]WRQ30115.1 hypothetical protein SD425_07555 [Hymenobacter sp. GOD-10R]